MSTFPSRRVTWISSPTMSALTASEGPDPTRKELNPDPAELKVLTLPDSTLTTDGCAMRVCLVSCLWL